MAQAEKRNVNNDNHILIQFQAPEGAIPQVLVKEPELEKDKSQSDEKNFRKKLIEIFSKGKSIDAVKGDIDAQVISYRNYINNF